MIRKKEALSLYQKLVLVRLAEETIREEYFNDEMKTPVHLGIGAYAISVGVCHCLPSGAKTFGTYRNHALYLAVTGDTDGFFAELYGKLSGPGKGKAGSMHLCAPARGLMATSAVVGTTIPVAVGAALANAYRKGSDIVAVFFGDGAVEEGVFWESLNFASLKRLPVLFVCEDNNLAIHAHASERRGFRSIPDAVRAFDCHLGIGDGSDLLSVAQNTRAVLAQMTRDLKPGFLHFTYFRFLEHVGPREDFDAGYREKPGPKEMARLDPVRRLETELLRRGVASSAMEAIRAEASAKVRRSAEEAQKAPFAPPAELTTDVWA
ncbi:MAG: thiamine pyrophosphate-dependent dehydrogenase E1 component subunit alpha [Deltaproteobacteria bacterium]|nr:thiamine pyrophosphate-dependent dehydrogenase E1 component subunit alpha [Deltaproteobacteria bacterium]